LDDAVVALLRSQQLAANHEHEENLST
jgi:hypothetical protein